MQSAFVIGNHLAVPSFLHQVSIPAGTPGGSKVGLDGRARKLIYSEIFAQEGRLCQDLLKEAMQSLLGCIGEDGAPVVYTDAVQRTTQLR